MKDLDKPLQASAPAPCRELRADFTATTLAKLAEYKHTKLGHLKETFTMRFAKFARAHKPATIAAAVIGLIVISGTASAATIGWPNVLALFSGQKTFTDGSRVVKVETKNCQFVTAINVTKPRTGNDGVYYYRVKADSHFSNDQITQMVQGFCDEEAEGKLNTQALEQITGADANLNHDLVGGYIDNVITAISPTTLTVNFSVPVGSANGTSYRNAILTFNHIDPHAVVLYKGTQIAFGDLKVGDHISYNYHATGDALNHSETMSPWQLNTNEATLAIIIKNTADMTAAMKYQQHNGTDFQEVTPCATGPNGYCTIEELNKK